MIVFWLFVGTYTGEKSKGIYLMRFDPADGSLGEATLAATTPNPTFLALDPAGKHLFAANEIGNFAGKKAGALTAYAIDRRTGALRQLNQQSSGGPGPCHCLVDATGKNLLVANYGGGSVASLPIRDDGTLGEASSFIQHRGSSVNRQRQEGPHAHHITPDPANRFVLCCDLGLDKVLSYRFDPAMSTLTVNDPPGAPIDPGSGPRHLSFHPGGRFAYVINELNSTVTACAYDPAAGVLKPLQSVSTLPENASAKNYTAEVEVHPSGKFVYGSNRGHDSIAVFVVQGGSGLVKLIQNQPCGGKVPRHFTIDPTGRYLLCANQDSDNVVVFRIDSGTGRLSPTGVSRQGIGSPVCLKFVAAQ